MSRHVGRSHDTEGRPRDPRPQNRRFKQLRMWRDKREDDRETDAEGGAGTERGAPRGRPRNERERGAAGSQQGSGARRPGTRTWGKAAALASLSPPRATGRIGVSRDPPRPYDAVAEMHAHVWGGGVAVGAKPRDNGSWAEAPSSGVPRATTPRPEGVTCAPTRRGRLPRAPGARTGARPTDHPAGLPADHAPGDSRAT